MEEQFRGGTLQIAATAEVGPNGFKEVEPVLPVHIQQWAQSRNDRELNVWMGGSEPVEQVECPEI